MKINLMTLGSLLAVLAFQVAQADSYTCQGQDLGISMSRDNSNCLSGGACIESQTLTVSCKGKNPLKFSASSPLPVQASGLQTPATGWDVSFLSSNIADIANVQHGQETLKQYLAFLLTAKSSNFPVTVSFDSKSSMNYGDGMAILGLSF